MEPFFMKSASGAASLEFFDRSNSDPKLLYSSYWVRLTDLNLSAAAQVYIGYDYAIPSTLFAEMAGRWKGWTGELTWSSTEGEFRLSARHDRIGHVSLRIGLRSGSYEDDWSLRTTIVLEPGQLEDLARRATAFFESR